MKEAGINRAFIGNIGLEGIQTPYKTVPFYSEEWWKILHAALKTATELGIEIGSIYFVRWFMVFPVAGAGTAGKHPLPDLAGAEPYLHRVVPQQGLHL